MRCQAPFHRATKSLFTTAALSVVVLTLGSGCARYKVTMANQSVTTARGKPKYDKKTETVTFTDAMGEKRVVPKIQVQSVEPY